MKRSLRFEDILAALPIALAELLTLVARVAGEEGCELQLVGGPIRDLLLGREVVDVDLVVASDPRELADAIVGYSRDETLKIVAHDRFGTLRIETSDAHVDLAQLRAESYEHPGALPRVRPGDLSEDMHRRDFGVNALVCALDASHPGSAMQISDLEGGLEDLDRRRLRILHPRSFHDDPTRIWRAARLSARLETRLQGASR